MLFARAKWVAYLAGVPASFPRRESRLPVWHGMARVETTTDAGTMDTHVTTESKKIIETPCL